jgi:hypothetical protein
MRLLAFLFLAGCNGRIAADDATVASACDAACHHVFTCEGTQNIDSLCQQTCAEAGAGPYTSQCGDASALVSLFECLEGLPCSDFPTDAGTLPSAQANCIEQNCP